MSDSKEGVLSWLIDILHRLFAQSPEIALFLALAGGYWVGKFRFGKFQLGGVAGALLVAVLLSQVGVHIDNGVKSVLFALFIYAVGFESGPQFFRSLGRQSLREIVMAVVLAVTGLATVVVLARVFGLDKGLAAGVAAGGLTQSAIIGTASAALAKLALPADEIQRLQANVAIGYAVTYIFGSFGAIIMCVNVLPWLTRRGIRDDALRAEKTQLAGATPLGADEGLAAPDLVGRLFRVQQGAGRTLGEFEADDPAGRVSVERVRRADTLLAARADLMLQANDVLLLVGRRARVLALAAAIGPELPSADGMELVMVHRDIAITSRELLGHTAQQIRTGLADDLRHGVYVLSLKRAGKALTLTPQTRIESGDVVTLYGTSDDVQRVARAVGPALLPSDKTDFVFHGLGLVAGLLIGLVVVRIGSIPLTLGSGGGALLSGLLFGWYRGRKLVLGNMPIAASTLLRDLGLAGFVAVVGLQSGLQAVSTIRASGLSLFLIGVVVTLLPMLITLLVGRFVLRYDNSAVLAGALAGSRSANPAFGEVLDKAGNAIPTPAFAITYALANVFLTLLGPLVVAFV